MYTDSGNFDTSSTGGFLNKPYAYFQSSNSSDNGYWR